MSLQFRYFLSLMLLAPAYLGGLPSAFGKSDTTYIQLFPDQVTARIYLGEKVSLFDLEDRNLGRTFHYRPNNILGLGLGVTVRGFGINFSTRLPFHDPKTERFGRTRRYDLQLHRYRAHWAFDGYAQRYKGFHLNSLDGIDSVTGGADYPYWSNLTTLNIGLSSMYIFNGNRFSMRGSVNQQDWQLRSAGSFMAGAAFFARYIYNDGAIVPEYYQYPQFMEGEAVRHISNYGLTIRGGYGYNYVFRKHYFAGAAADVGAGPGYSIVRDVEGNERSGLGLNLAANLRLATGYNSQKWFAGVYVILHADRYDLPLANGKVSNAQGIFRLAVARRFTTHHKWLRSSRPPADAAIPNN